MKLKSIKFDTNLVHNSIYHWAIILTIAHVNIITLIIATYYYWDSEANLAILIFILSYVYIISYILVIAYKAYNKFIDNN